MPASNIGFAPFDIVVVPFPYSDRLAEKRRPALVVSSDVLRARGLIWVAMITSATRPSREEDVPIADLQSAGLQVFSVVRPAKIATIEPHRVVRRAGALDGASAKAVARILRQFLARR